MVILEASWVAILEMKFTWRIDGAFNTNSISLNALQRLKDDQIIKSNTSSCQYNTPWCNYILQIPVIKSWNTTETAEKKKKNSIHVQKCKIMTAKSFQVFTLLKVEWILVQTCWNKNCTSRLSFLNKIYIKDISNKGAFNTLTLNSIISVLAGV